MKTINYNNFSIRVFLDETVNKNFYCLSDVCKIMGNGNTSVNKKLLDNYFSEEDKSNVYRVLDIKDNNNIGRKNVIFINNECLLILVCKSRKKSSRGFRKFVISLLGG